MSGSVAVMEESRIVPLDLTVPQVMALLRALGAGQPDALARAVRASA
jgi:uncharacterized membrane protein